MYRVCAPIADAKNPYLSCDIFIYGSKYVYNSLSPLHNCIIAALAGARTYLFRALETCFGCKSDHFLLSQHVKFKVSISGSLVFMNSYSVENINLRI